MGRITLYLSLQVAFNRHVAKTIIKAGFIVKEKSPFFFNRPKNCSIFILRHFHSQEHWRHPAVLAKQPQNPAHLSA